MEVLTHLMRTQYDFENALRMEIEYEEVKNTKEGKRLLKWLRARRRAIRKFVKKFG